MPTVLTRNAGSSRSDYSREMGGLLESETRSEVPKISPESRETIAPKWAGSRKKLNKQSLDYVLRSGLAGGLAGCAVS